LLPGFGSPLGSEGDEAMRTTRPIAIYYEHPHWFQPLFAELSRRAIPHVKLDAARHAFDPAGPDEGYALLFNRMSPSAWNRGRGDAIFSTRDFVAHVFNGSRAFGFETSKALQVSLLHRLRLPVPRTRVVNHPSLLGDAARNLRFPLVVKPNVGGSGAGIVRFDDLPELVAAVISGRVGGGLDGTILLQEYHAPAGSSIVRVETLEGRYLYGIRIHLEAGAGFDLCPADVCKTVGGDDLVSAACPVGAAKAGLTVEAYEPPPEVIDQVERIAQAADIDVGGIEYLTSVRDGHLYYYDINALSNFVADPLRVVGFDPTERLVDALVARAGIDEAERPVAAVGGVRP
jgi:glutathione synthase/RimK-type ligase-like ATP-grasp enzyme